MTISDNSLRVAIVVPSLFGSTRLPGKPPADIGGKPMVQHVYERAIEVPGVDTPEYLERVRELMRSAELASAQ
jgi:CMP-2-keto-3-deoxyoctulosonic acid synthetase